MEWLIFAAAWGLWHGPRRLEPLDGLTFTVAQVLSEGDRRRG